MIRITTRLNGSCKASTLFYKTKWITFAFRGAVVVASWETDTFKAAGENHLMACEFLSKKG